MTTITSYGIALVKKNKLYNKKLNTNNLINKTCIDNNSYEILFIKKRLSYAYISFIRGVYYKNNDNEILKLLNNMTVDEKCCIMSLNFTYMWYKSYLSIPYNSYSNARYINKDLNKFEKCKIKFEKTFLYDKGNRLLNLIKKSKSIKKLWEIPKGMSSKNENNINAAIREFYEETNIKKNKYKLLYDVNPIEYIFVDDNIKYKYIYYIAVLLDNKYTPNIELSFNKNIMESADIRFLNLNEIKFINPEIKYMNFIKQIIKIAKLYFF